jgi:hypothetical protein
MTATTATTVTSSHRLPVTPAEFRTALGGAALIALTTAGAPALRHWYNRWGTQPDERTAVFPGDDLIPRPRLCSTRAVTIDAPVEEVWPWLAQIGQGRGGLYSYDVLENLIGCDIHSSDDILDDDRDPAVGELVRMGPDRYPAYRVAVIEPRVGVALLGVDPVTHQPPEVPVPPDRTAASWAWRLWSLPHDRCRLLARQRYAYPPRQSVLWHLVEPISFVMERRMLLGIKHRAEATRTRACPPAAVRSRLVHALLPAR